MLRSVAQFGAMTQTHYPQQRIAGSRYRVAHRTQKAAK
jgi:hypothetical protein